MTPFELSILLHYYSCRSEAEEVLRNPPILKETMDGLVDNQLLERIVPTDSATASFRLTERGFVFVEHVCALPLPMWRMP